MRILLGVLALVMLGGAGLIGYSLWSYRQQADIAVVSEPAAKGGGEEVSLVIAGPITPGTVTKVKAAIDRAPRVPGRFVIRSRGGSEAAARDLAAIINRLGADVEVSNRALCASVCVSLLSEVDPAHRRIDGGAWLRVADKGAGPTGWNVQIGRLSANWLGFLQGCGAQSQLLRSGITMTWDEVQHLNTDPHGLSCADLATRTSKWLSRVTDSNLFVHTGP